MPVDRLLIEPAPGQVRIAGLDAAAPTGRQLSFFQIFRTGDPLPTGAVVLGRVRVCAGGIDAAFVDIGEGADGFLGAADARLERNAPAAPIGAQVHEGEAVLVQVLRSAADEKGAKLTRRIALTGAHLVLLATEPGIEISRRIKDKDTRARLAALAEGFGGPNDRKGGWIVRTAAADADEAVVLAEAEALLTQFSAIEMAAKTATPPCVLDGGDLAGVVAAARADHPTAEVFEGEDVFAREGIADEVAALLSPDVSLPGGGRLCIEETRALTAIDVDTGAARGPGAALAVNLEAADEIARQLHLRGIGGLVVVDFVSLKKKADMDRVVAGFSCALGGEGRVSGPTPAGLVEITRRRTGPSLAGRLMWPRSATLTAKTLALEALARVAAEDRARPGRISGLRAAPAVIEALRGSAALADVEHRLGRALDLQAEAGFSEDRIELVTRAETA